MVFIDGPKAIYSMSSPIQVQGLHGQIMIRDQLKLVNRPMFSSTKELGRLLAVPSLSVSLASALALALALSATSSIPTILIIGPSSSRHSSLLVFCFRLRFSSLNNLLA